MPDRTRVRNPLSKISLGMRVRSTLHALPAKKCRLKIVRSYYENSRM